MRAVSVALNRFVERYLPNAFLFAVILTVITVLLGIVMGGQSLSQMAEHWYGGFWSFLAFGMQMLLILVTGYALAKAPLVERGMSALARIPQRQVTALLLSMVVSAALGFISWGLGFVAGTLVAIEIAKRLPVADFRLLVAASYAAVVATQPVSLALTAPLLVNTPGHSLEEQIGLIPVTETLFSPTMIACAVLGFIGVVAAFLLMAPKEGDVVSFQSGEAAGPSSDDGRGAAATVTKTRADRTPAERIDNSRILNYAIVIFGLIAGVLYFMSKGFNLELNIINFLFIILGLALHGGPTKYADCITSGIPAASGIVLQFPFYAGIIGMMTGAGLIGIIGQAFGSIASEATFPVLTYIAAMIINIFVPSAGGQWQVQGPVMLEASSGLAVDPAMLVNAVSVGDMTTNLLQPFFVLPALGLSGLGLKDIWGYCMTAMLVLIVICGGVFLLAPQLGW